MSLTLKTDDNGSIVAIVTGNPANNNYDPNKLVDAMGSRRVKTFDMGGSSQAKGDSFTLWASARMPRSFTVSVAANTNSDIQNPDLQLELAEAFGSDIAQMGDFVKEILQSLGPDSTLSKEQQDSLLEMVTEIINLKKSDGDIATTANRIADLLLEGMDNKSIAPAISEFVQGMLVDIAHNNNIPDLDEKLVKIEGRMNPEDYLENSATDIIAQLTEMLETQDLSDEARAEIEAIIENMEKALEQGEPIPRDVMEALEALGENHHDISLSKEFTASLETLQDANIVMKADNLGISVEQMQTIETTIENLDGQLQEMLENGEYTEAEIEEIQNAIEKLEAFADEGTPLDRETLKTLETIAEAYPNVTTDIPLASIETIKEANTIVKAEELGISVEQMQAIEANIETLDTKLQEMQESGEEYTAEERAEIEAAIEKLEAFKEEGVQLDQDSIESLKALAKTYPDLDIEKHIPDITEIGGDAPRGFESDADAKPAPSGQDDTGLPDNNAGHDDLAPDEPTGGDDVATPTPEREEPVSFADDSAETRSEPEQKNDGAGDPPVDENSGEPEKENPEIDKDDPKEPENKDPVPEKDKGNDPQEKTDPVSPCGEKICTCPPKKDFNSASRNEDGTIDLKLANGDTVTVEAKEADKMIDKEVKENLEIADKNWNKTLDQFDGDKVKAFEYLNDQIQQEAKIASDYVGSKTNYDDNAALLAAQMRAGQPASTTHEGPSAKGPFHDCGPECNHSTKKSNTTKPNNTGHKSEQVDITSLGKTDNTATTATESVGKPKKTKKTKTPKPPS